MENIKATPSDKNFLQILTRKRFKTLLIIAGFILVWIAIIFFLSNYIKSSSASNWSELEKEKNAERYNTALSQFNSYESELIAVSDNLANDPELVKQVQKSDSKKLFESLFKKKLNEEYQVEFYNTRLELLAFKGRKIDSDIYSLQKCSGGKKFSIIKEIGFYTYLVTYFPIYDNSKTYITGIVLTARLIDIKYQINNKFFQNVGLLSDIRKELNVTSELYPGNPISGKIDFDTTLLNENVPVYLNGIDGTVIGVLLVPKYSSITHAQTIDNLSRKIISMLVFGLSVIILLICLRFILGTSSPVLKFLLLAATLVVIRLVWLEFSFPSRLLNFEIFSPAFYASAFGFGIAKSPGEFLITSIFILIISLYGASLVFKRIDRRYFAIRTKKGFTAIFQDLILITIFFAGLYVYGSVIQSIVFDSNLKFFDRSSIIPSPELFIIQLVVLILTFSLFVFLICVTSLILRNDAFSFLGRKNIRKYSFLLLLATLLVVNQLAAPALDEFRINYIFRLLIILSGFGFAAYLSKINYNKHSIFTVKNFSIIILFCIIVVPGILLEKIISQEKHFVELIGTKITERDDERIRFLLLTELSAIAESKKIENEIRNKNKLPELAFSIWSDSKFSEENYNTAVVLFDTGKKVLSDFTFNSQGFDIDSVSAFAKRNYFKKNLTPPVIEDTTTISDDSLETEVDSGEDYEEEEADTDNSSIYSADNIMIFKNDEEKYYLGIVTLQKIELKNTAYQQNVGYLLIAVKYETSNLLFQSSMQLFKNYSRDNLFDKLISTPIITEYVSGEIVSSTDPDLSKTSTLSLDAFRETVKAKNEKFDWRYETINNEKYRTLYILATPASISENEKIYSIGLKRNDFKLTTFFYLKYILFAIFIYLMLLTVITFFVILKIRSPRLNFREKLFASFFIVSVIPIVLLAVYTRSFIKEKYDYNIQNEIVSDLNLVSQNIKSNQMKISDADSLSREQNKIFTRLLKTDKNFNLFLKTKLVSTTDEELYKSDLLDTRVDADAYYNIVFLRKDFFSKTEEIGVYPFIVGYKPYFDSKNNIIGLISSQAVYKQNEINEEQTEILTFIFGIYFIVIILLLVFVAFLTDRISKPILKLQTATEKISKGESNVELNIKRKDEIGTLVDSFNKMSRELDVSKENLKKAEREAAWREIARRVAHEIKNPLTPMKLSIQHLDEVYNNGNKESFPEVLKKTRNIIINEIDKLNHIATEFSNFAKLPGRNYQETDLNSVIEDVMSLYRLMPNIEFKESLSKDPVIISADRHELNRAFQNLIKNSVQAIEVNGVIEVKTYVSGGFVFAEISDNGCGIDKAILNNMFEPNFSTKSTGMGLGLAITKKTLDDMKAEISFQSEKGKGTHVTLKFRSVRGS